MIENTKHDEAEERLPLADQHLDRRHQRIFAGPEHELGELEDGQGDAERQAHGGADDRQAQQKAPATEPHGCPPQRHVSGMVALRRAAVTQGSPHGKTRAGHDRTRDVRGDNSRSSPASPSPLRGRVRGGGCPQHQTCCTTPTPTLPPSWRSHAPHGQGGGRGKNCRCVLSLAGCWPRGMRMSEERGRQTTAILGNNPAAFRRPRAAACLPRVQRHRQRAFGPTRRLLGRRASSFRTSGGCAP